MRTRATDFMVVAAILGIMIVVVAICNAEEIERPNPPNEIHQPYPVLCWNESIKEWVRVVADCNPVNNASCPDPCANVGKVHEVGEDECIHPNGQPYKEHWTACDVQNKQLAGAMWYWYRVALYLQQLLAEQ